MKRANGWIILLLALLALSPTLSWAREKTPPQWNPRLFLTATGSVWSPGGSDKDRYLASLGGSLSANYWFNWNTQFMITASYASLNTERFYWQPESLADSLTADLWEVKGSLWAVSVEMRRLYPADRVNFLYLGLGADYIHYGNVEGHWESYGAQPAIISGNITEKRAPDYAFGGHISPGMFFLFYPRVSMDVAVKVHVLYDTDELYFWLEPAFTVGVNLPGLAKRPQVPKQLLPLPTPARTNNIDQTQLEEKEKLAEEAKAKAVAEEKAKAEAERIAELETKATREAEEVAIASLKPMHFDFAKSAIRSDSQEDAQFNVEHIKKYPNWKVVIEGHCDERGSRTYNHALGEHRANAIKEYFIRQGFAAERFIIISYGEDKPVDDGHNKEAWAKNRRVVIVIEK